MHPLRKKILFILDKKDEFSHKELMHELNIQREKLLKFHVCKLFSLISRKDKYYSLTEEGKMVVQILKLIKDLSHLDKNDNLETNKMIFLKKEEELREEKIKFLTLFAHQIKTPLVSIFGYTEYIVRKYKNLNENLKEDLNKIYKNTKILLKKIDKSIDDYYSLNTHHNY